MTHATQPAAAARTSPRSPDFFGKHVPNLVMVLDSGADKLPEFRIQLEIALTEAEAKAVIGHLWGDHIRNDNDLREAKKVVLDGLPCESSKMFRLIIGQAFDDQPEMGASAGQPPIPCP